MIEVKEIRNTVNGKEFISKDYLLEQAISFVNYYVRLFYDEVRNGDRFNSCTYETINVLFIGYVRIGIFSDELCELFLKELLLYSYDPKYLKTEWYPQLLSATCYTLSGTYKKEN